jgi:hypothetical protein
MVAKMSKGQHPSLGHDMTPGDTTDAELREFHERKVEANVGMRFDSPPILVENCETIRTTNHQNRVEHYIINTESGEKFDIGAKVAITILSEETVPHTKTFSGTTFLRARVVDTTQSVDHTESGKWLDAYDPRDRPWEDFPNTASL